MAFPLGRRDFLNYSTSITAAVLASHAGWTAEPKKAKLKKAVKFDMVKIKGSNQEKLELVKKLGFLGVEINSPSGLNLDDLVKARDATGVAVHGVIDSVHWEAKYQLSSPNEEAREKGLRALEGALQDAKKVGADTVLLVPGVVTKEVTYEQCYERSQAEVKKALPLAEKLKVKIAIEVVWNNFITKPEQLIQYVDDFKSEWVGAYFDCSNMLKYGVSSADWIRKLGKRMLKFDFKGYSIPLAKEKKDEWGGFNVKIGEGSEDWPEVLKALAEIGYDGWATAEVSGGGEKELKDVADRMNKVLGLE